MKKYFFYLIIILQTSIFIHSYVYSTEKYYLVPETPSYLIDILCSDDSCSFHNDEIKINSINADSSKVIINCISDCGTFDICLAHPAECSDSNISKNSFCISFDLKSCNDNLMIESFVDELKEILNSSNHDYWIRGLESDDDSGQIRLPMFSVLEFEIIKNWDILSEIGIKEIFFNSLTLFIILLIFIGIVIIKYRDLLLDSKDLLIIILLFSISLIIKLLGPRVPANHSSYEIYLGRFLLLFGAGNVVFVFNIILSSLTCVIFYAALKQLKYTRIFCIIFSLLLCFLPIYVRLSATDAPHNFIFFNYSLCLLMISLYSKNQKYFYIIVSIYILILSIPLRIDSSICFLTIPFFALYKDTLRDSLKKYKKFIVLYYLSFVIMFVFSFLFVYDISLINKLAANFFAPDRFSFLYSLEKLLLYISGTFIITKDSLISCFPFIGFWICVILLAYKRRIYKIILLFLILFISSLPLLLTNVGSHNNTAVARYFLIPSVYFVFPTAVIVEKIVNYIRDNKYNHFLYKKIFLLIFLISILSYSIINSVSSYKQNLLFQEEYLFLKKSLPEYGTIVTIGLEEKEDDVCRGLPDLLLIADFPELRWRSINTSYERFIEDWNNLSVNLNERDVYLYINPLYHVNYSTKSSSRNRETISMINDLGQITDFIINNTNNQIYHEEQVSAYTFNDFYFENNLVKLKLIKINGLLELDQD